MSTCTWTKKIEAFVDGEMDDSAATEAHLAECDICADHHATLLQLRAAVSSLSAAPTLSEEQFPAFMAGIQEGTERSGRRSGGIWTLMSLSAAALVIAIATFSIFTGPGPVKANEVESVSTQIDGATVDWENSDDGVTTIWISIGEDDV
jgi:anti-sigma factor RsiW